MKDLVLFQSSALAIKGEVEAAAHWLTFAERCEQLKLFGQVMAGFELIAIWKKYGFYNGRRADLSHDGKGVSNSEAAVPLMTVDSVCERLGKSKTLVYRLMDFAKAAAPRLKKLPALRDFDPESSPVSALPATKMEAVTTAVRKLTDGMTQLEFGEQMGLWKKAPGNRNSHANQYKRQPGDGKGADDLTNPFRDTLIDLYEIVDEQSPALAAPAVTEEFLAQLERALDAAHTRVVNVLKSRKGKESRGAAEPRSKSPTPGAHVTPGTSV